MRRPPGDLFENIEPLFGRGRRPDLSGWAPSGRAVRRLLLLGALVLLVLAIAPLVGGYTDWLWFRQLGFESIYLTRLRYQLELGAAGFIVATVLLLVSNLAALRLQAARGLSAIGVRRRTTSSPAGRLVAAVSLVAGIVMGAIASSAWETVALAGNAASFGRPDPVFNQDIGFYVFQLPAYGVAWGWLLGLLLVMIAAAALVYLAGISTPGQLSLPRSAVGHLSLLGSAFFLLLAYHYRLAMFGLLTSRHGAVFDAGYTDIHARLPGDWILLVACLGLALVLLANVFLARPSLLALAPAAWLVLVVLVLGIYPALVQRLQVQPAELSQERDFIAREIQFTNSAYALDRITTQDFPAKDQVTPDLLAANQGTVANLRVWDYAPLQKAYTQLQSLRLYYDFIDVDIDRYHLADAYRQIMISARELNLDSLQPQAQTWVNLHLKYTHGYGATATPVNMVGTEGQPAFILQDIPPKGQLTLDRPQIYFGEGQPAGSYVVANSAEPELDHPVGDQESYSHWQGTHGVSLGSGLRRLAFALRFGDPNLILSSQITPDSQLLFNRSVTERLGALAPFLTLDHDPYVVVSGGRLYWITDAYTTSNEYPYSSPFDLGSGNSVNYMRNSVKVVVDAYEGTVQFYVADAEDPVLATYGRIFPGVFEPISSMPPDLRSHVRYPEDLFTIQAVQLETFHMHDPGDFYNKGDAWALPSEVTNQAQSQVTLQPYYVLMRLPGETTEEFVLIQPYTPVGKKNMVAWLAARSDGANYGKLLNFRFPTGRQVVGPSQVESRIDQDPSNSQLFTLLNQQGSHIIRGNLLVIPMGDAVLFMEPIFIESTSSSLPELKYVIVADEQREARGTTLDEALSLLVGGAAPTTTTPPGGPPPSADVQALIKQLGDVYADSQAKLKAGDFTGYAADIQKIGDLIRQLQQKQAGGATPSPSPSPSP